MIVSDSKTPNTETDAYAAERVTELEHRAGIASLDALQQRRRAIVNDLAPYEALHGPGGVWDEQRRSLRGVYAAEIRDMRRAAQIKTTESEVEDLAAADPRYRARLDQAEKDCIAYLTLKVQRDEISELIANRDLCLRAYMAEMRLT